MNLDELIKNIRNVSKEDVVQKLADYLQDWKTGEKNVIDLSAGVERFLGNVWIEKDEDFEKINEMWSNFKDTAIGGIGGMTMNERLYWFGLFNHFDHASNDSERTKFYAKLMGKK